MRQGDRSERTHRDLTGELIPMPTLGDARGCQLGAPQDPFLGNRHASTAQRNADIADCDLPARRAAAFVGLNLLLDFDPAAGQIERLRAENVTTEWLTGDDRCWLRRDPDKCRRRKWPPALLPTLEVCLAVASR